MLQRIAIKLEVKLKEGRKVRTLKVNRHYVPLELSAAKHIKYAMADILEKLADS